LIGAGVLQSEAEKHAHIYFDYSINTDLSTRVWLGQYQSPPLVVRDISTLKTLLFELGEVMGIPKADKNIDSSYIYCREVYFHFTRLHIKQTLESTFTTKEDIEMMKLYKNLTEQAAKERPLTKSCNRFMESEAFPSRLIKEHKFESEVWRANKDENEEMIYNTIKAVVNNKIDNLLLGEIKLMDANDLEKVEEMLERIASKYLLAHVKDAIIQNEFNTQRVDLTPLDMLYNSSLESKEGERVKKASWKHVIKAYLIERILLMREYKRKIVYALNYFNSIKLRLTQDITEITTKEHNDREYKANSKLRMIYIAQDEIRVVDHNDSYIFLESTLTEFNKVIERLLECGTYYITQYQERIGVMHSLDHSIPDRGLVLLDLLRQECQYQYTKIEVLSKLCYIYEHTNDYDKIQVVGQLIYDFIERRPRLQLTGEYFVGAYKLEIECMNKYKDLLIKVITRQVKEEAILSEANSHRKEKKELLCSKLKVKEKIRKKGSQVVEIKKEKDEVYDPYVGKNGESYKLKLEDILELTPMTEEQIFIAHTKAQQMEAKDEKLLDYFKFISFNEGYSLVNSPLLYEYDNTLPKYNIGDLYTSLAEISRVLLAVRQALKDMIAYYEAESGLAISGLECILLQYVISGYEELIDYSVSSHINELKSIETNSLADSAEILIYLIKQLASDINKNNLYEVNPKLVAQLSPSLLKELDFEYFNKGGFVKNNMKQWPTLLKFLCNIVEFSKLKEHLISSLYETERLSELYQAQQELVSNQSFLNLKESILSNKGYRNPYINSPICNECRLNFAIKEFCNEFQYLLCFHSCDCLKLIVVFCFIIRLSI